MNFSSEFFKFVQFNTELKETVGEVFSQTIEDLDEATRANEALNIYCVYEITVDKEDAFGAEILINSSDKIRIIITVSDVARQIGSVLKNVPIDRETIKKSIETIILDQIQPLNVFK